MSRGVTPSSGVRENVVSKRAGYKHVFTALRSVLPNAISTMRRLTNHISRATR
jgi:hypothetical protein